MREGVRLVPLLFILWSCAETELAPLPPEKLDASYQKVTIDWRGDMLGASTDFYLKRFATDGKLAFCGVRDGEKTGTYAELVSTWFVRAYIEIRGEKAVTLSFLSVYAPEVEAARAMANCVKTTIPASLNLSAPMTLKGSDVKIY